MSTTAAPLASILSHDVTAIHEPEGLFDGCVEYEVDVVCPCGYVGRAAAYTDSTLVDVDVLTVDCPDCGPIDGIVG